MLDRIVGFPKAVYNFFVGDPIILTGVVAFFVVIGLIAHAHAPSNGASVALGALLMVGVIGSLALSLYRETRPKKG